MNDFSNWIKTNYDLPELASAIRGIDVGFFTLEEVRGTILDLVNQYIEKPDDNTPDAGTPDQDAKKTAV
jgi:hypothetical protein